MIDSVCTLCLTEDITKDDGATVEIFASEQDLVQRKTEMDAMAKSPVFAEYCQWRFPTLVRAGLPGTLCGCPSPRAAKYATDDSVTQAEGRVTCSYCTAIVAKLLALVQSDANGGEPDANGDETEDEPIDLGDGDDEEPDGDEQELA